jgi:hypothetical protein
LAEEGDEVLGTLEDGVPEEVLLAGGPEGFVGLLEGEDMRGRRRKRKILSK